MTIAIDAIIKHVRTLPSLPAVITELLTTMDRQDVDLGSLVSKISLDQALTAKTLRLANSSFYGMPSTVTTIGQAISILGFRSIRTLLTACSVTAAFPRDANALFDFEGFWRHSVATAVCAQKLARQLDVNPDTAFTAALLHDIGVLVIATGFPEQFGAVLAHRHQHDCYMVEAELAVLGIDHTAVGSALARHWNFPLDMQHAVAGHHQLEPTGLSPLCMVVQAANVIAHGLDLGGAEDALAPPLSRAVWDALDLDEERSAILFADVENTFDDMCQVLVS